MCEEKEEEEGKHIANGCLEGKKREDRHRGRNEVSQRRQEENKKKKPESQGRRPTGDLLFCQLVSLELIVGDDDDEGSAMIFV